MSSRLHIVKSRRPSRKSDAPSSAAGKATASRNSRAFEAFAEALREPSAADIADLTTQYLDRFRPDGPFERRLVDLLIRCDWITRRLRIAEAAFWNQGFVPGEDNRHFLARALIQDKGRLFEQIGRSSDRTLKTYLQTLKELTRLQAERISRQRAALLQAVPLGPYSIN